MNRSESVRPAQRSRSGLPEPVRLLGLADPATPTEVGHKFVNLARHAGSHPVPVAAAVTTTWFSLALDEYHDSIEQLLDQLAATDGATILDTADRIQKLLAGLEVPRQCREVIGAWMARRPSRHGWCVRSSAADEDTGLTSAAGVYRSELHLHGLDEVCAAVARSWRACFELPALTHRLRCDTVRQVPTTGIILQHMVDATLAGVAIATPGRLIALEYVEGTGDALVSGQITPYTVTGVDAVSTAHRPAVAAAAELARSLANARAEMVDVEWAHDGAQIWLLQVRPVVDTGAATAKPGTAVLHGSDLYSEQPLARDLRLGRLTGLIHALRAKRTPAFRVARSIGLATVRGTVLTVNREGLISGALAEKVTWLADRRTDEAIIDVGPEVRQIIVTQDRLVDTLIGLLGMSHHDPPPQTVLVREFDRGDRGLIMVHLGRGEILAEWSVDGLLAMNRGSSRSSRLRLSRLTDGVDDYVDAARSIGVQPDQLRKAARTTIEIDAFAAGAHVEWTSRDGHLTLVDYSRDLLRLTGVEHARVMSAGTASGPVFHLAEIPNIESLSLAPSVNSYGVADGFVHQALSRVLRQLRDHEYRPIIFADRPHAALAAFLDDAAGFVFREGGMLCHLAILLRERGIPAVVCDIGRPAGTWVDLDGVTVTSRI